MSHRPHHTRSASVAALSTPPRAAITLLLADIAGNDSLVPAPGAPERGKFLRWLVFIVANIYPTFTYADDPSRFVSVNAARDPLDRKSVV